MVPEVFVPTVFFLFLGAVILGPIWLRERTRQSGHRLVQRARERGQSVDPALVRELTGGKTPQAQPERARKTLGNGVILLALAIGFAAGGLFGDSNGMYVPATILGALGAAFILLAMVDYAEKKKEG